ncbi:hypothetical protein UM822_02650 [Staphylococcus aureus]|nr:hypothetical protein UM822_02650 [Staphylococcus aureus]
MAESDELDICFNSNHFQHYMMLFYSDISLQYHSRYLVMLVIYNPFSNKKPTKMLKSMVG